jgi:MinD-like ATPase involved in chromosome partitioning or flagellar assembly
MRARVLVLLGASPWEGSVVAGLTHPASRVEIARRCVDTADLLAASAAGLAQVAVIGADAPRLDSDVLARVQDSGLVLIALINRGDERARDLMTSWGADVVVEIDPQELGKGVSELVGSVHQLADRGRSSIKSEDEGREEVMHADGRVICVWGPAGAPGRTTVAIGVADECANSGLRTILIDADTWAPSISLALGLADDGVGLASACRRALTGALDVRSFQSLLRPINDRLAVLTGIGRADRWTEVRRSAFLTVLQRACAQADVVVIDCGAPLESDEELLFDTSAPRRNAATFVALEQATDIVVVGSADPVGLVRLVNGLSELRALELEGEVHVVANRVRESMLGRHENDSVADVLSRHAKVDRVWCIPQDSQAMDHSLREGCTLSEIGDSSPARVAMAALVSAMAAASNVVPRSA